MCACVCLLGKQSNLEQERGREKVCLDQLLSKSVYSAQFGIKHNRLLSACSCLWCPIKMEFIAALRARPKHTFLPLRSVLLHPSLICTLSFVVVMVFFVLTSSSSCQSSLRNGSLQTQTGRYGWRAQLPVSTSPLSPLTPECMARISYTERSRHSSCMWWSPHTTIPL